MPKKTKVTAAEDDEIEIISTRLSDSDMRLNKLFEDMERSSLDTLENAARQIITLGTSLIAAFFGLLALKDAPAYLDYYDVKVFGGLALTSFFFAVLAALIAVYPEKYDFSQASLTAKQSIYNKMLTRKHDAAHWATRIFIAGVFFLLAAVLDILMLRL